MENEEIGINQIIYLEKDYDGGIFFTEEELTPKSWLIYSTNKHAERERIIFLK